MHFQRSLMSQNFVQKLFMLSNITHQPDCRNKTYIFKTANTVTLHSCIFYMLIWQATHMLCLGKLREKRDWSNTTKTSQPLKATMWEMEEIDAAFQLIPPQGCWWRKDDWEAAGALTWKSTRIIDGKRAQHLILLSDGVCCRRCVVSTNYQGELEVTQRNMSL